MKRSKKIFLTFAVVFFVAIAYLGYDISRRTTFPGSQSLSEEKPVKKDSKDTEKDSMMIYVIKSPKSNSSFSSPSEPIDTCLAINRI